MLSCTRVLLVTWFLCADAQKDDLDCAAGDSPLASEGGHRSGLLQLASGTHSLNQKIRHEASEGGRYAFVTMWYFVPGGEHDRDDIIALSSFPASPSKFDDSLKAHPKGIVNLIEQLGNVSTKYPLLVLTNNPARLGVLASSPHLRVQILPLADITFPCPEAFYHKLQMFDIHGYDKLLWLDADVQVNRNIDHIFERDLNNGQVVFTQDDQYGCDGKHFTSMCSGVMLFQRDEAVLPWCMEQMQKMQPQCPGGDQVILGQYFASNQKQIQWFGQETVQFYHCGRDADVVHWQATWLPNSNTGHD